MSGARPPHGFEIAELDDPDDIDDSFEACIANKNLDIQKQNDRRSSKSKMTADRA
jgi:hypothetical protein